MAKGDIPTLLPEGFKHQAHGATAAINSLSIYACPICGASVVERDNHETNRTIHVAWHKRVGV